MRNKTCSHCGQAIDIPVYLKVLYCLGNRKQMKTSGMLTEAIGCSDSYLVVMINQAKKLGYVQDAFTGHKGLYKITLPGYLYIKRRLKAGYNFEADMKAFSIARAQIIKRHDRRK